MAIFRAVIILCLAVHLAVSGRVLVQDPTFSSFIRILYEPWGLQVTLDLLFGFLLMAFVIYVIEGDIKRTAWWTLALFTFGNPVSALFILMRMDKMGQKLSPGAPLAS